MSNDWQKRWDDRYGDENYAYGTIPNNYLTSELAKLAPGKIIFGAEGEGRNAVHAARSGWKVSAFDISMEGKNKALKLATEHQVSVDYQVGLLPKLSYDEASFDAIALIYAHFPPDIKAEYHKILDRYLKPGGHIIFEAFGKQHLAYKQQNPKIGGPSDLDSLYSIDELKSYFPNYEILELVEMEVELHEGLYHNGLGSVVRFFARKPN